MTRNDVLIALVSNGDFLAQVREVWQELTPADRALYKNFRGFYTASLLKQAQAVVDGVANEY